MNLHIDKESELTAYEQLREQIIFLISTGEIKIGEEMPSVRGLARQLGVSLNTVSKVYSGLVRGGWLIEHPGAHHKVVEWKRRAQRPFSGASLDELIDHTIELALGNGYSLQQLADHLRKRLLEQPPDHLVIVEPDPGIGEIMQDEIGKKIGFGPARYSLTSLQMNPAIGIGALLIAPVYIVERLGRFGVDRTRIIGVSYSPLDNLIAAISRLSRPSMIGWISVSEAGLKTVSGMAAPAIGNRHSSHFFLLKRRDPDEAGQFTLRRFRVGGYTPGDILKVTEHTASPKPSAAESGIAEFKETVSASDLRCMDTLFLDSVSSRLIEHPHGIHYRLLSDSSLEIIEAAAKSLS
jgi:DNA-binding transcriptional regulator YhcF (GntR family)